MSYKKALEDVLMNLRCIDITENKQVGSYIDDSIRIIVGLLEDKDKTAQEVPVQEQNRFVPTDSSGTIYPENQSSIKCQSNQGCCLQ